MMLLMVCCSQDWGWGGSRTNLVKVTFLPCLFPSNSFNCDWGRWEGRYAAEGVYWLPSSQEASGEQRGCWAGKKNTRKVAKPPFSLCCLSTCSKKRFSQVTLLLLSLLLSLIIALFLVVTAFIRSFRLSLFSVYTLWSSWADSLSELRAQPFSVFPASIFSDFTTLMSAIAFSFDHCFTSPHCQLHTKTDLLLAALAEKWISVALTMPKTRNVPFHKNGWLNELKGELQNCNYSWS